MFNSVKTKVTYHTTIAEVKSQINMEQSYTADDTYLTQLVKRATSLAENYLDADIAKTTIVYEHYDFSGTQVIIHDTPFISLQSVVYLDSAGDEQTVTLADIEIKKSIQKTFLILPDSLDTDLLTASYTTGYTETLASGTVTLTGTSGDITSMKVNSVEIMNGTVTWDTDVETVATAIVASITAKTSVPEYTATSVLGVITITAIAGTGATPNTFVIATTESGGDIVAVDVALSGGLAADVPIEIQDAILLKSSDLYDVQRGSFISKSFVDSGAFERGLDFHKKISY